MKDELYSVRMRASDHGGRHISGAECIAPASLVERQAGSYIKRAMAHSRGMPSEVVVTVERIKGKPRRAGLLAVSTVECHDTALAENEIKARLAKEGVSTRAIAAGLRLIRSSGVMRGAAIVDARSGRRLEPDSRRGVRATRLGMDPGALRRLKGRLARRGINIPAVVEALTLASKVAAAPGVMAELCASDDPGYTTGYIASARLGYVRITNIKPPGNMSGGRVLFVKSGTDIDRLVRFLQRTAVVVGDARTPG